jgi:hypothetical protein
MNEEYWLKTNTEPIQTFVLETVEQPDWIITNPTQQPDEHCMIQKSELIPKEEFKFQENDVSFADDAEYEEYVEEYMQQQANQANYY